MSKATLQFGTWTTALCLLAGSVLADIPFGGTKRTLTDIFFLVLCRDARTHLQVLARLGRMLQLPGFLDSLRAAPDNATSFDVICAADRQVVGETV